VRQALLLETESQPEHHHELRGASGKVRSSALHRDDGSGGAVQPLSLHGISALTQLNCAALLYKGLFKEPSGSGGADALFG
jgi:hypothetical protein